MGDERKLRSLEGLGYVGAFMFGVGGLINVEALRYFNVLGLVLAIIVIVRLMVMNIDIRMLQSLYEPSGPSEPEAEA